MGTDPKSRSDYFTQPVEATRVILTAEEIAAFRAEIAAGADRDAGIVLERQAGPRPVRPEVFEREVGGADVGDVTSEDEIQHGRRVVLRGRSDPARHRPTLPAPPRGWPCPHDRVRMLT